MKEKTFEKKDLVDYLKKLDAKLDEEVELILFGGSAMMIAGNKGMSKDVDIIYFSKDSDFPDVALDVWEDLKHRPDQLDMHKDFDMGLLRIPDYRQKAVTYSGLKLKKITLKLLNPADVVISKLCRGNPEDIKDVYSLLDSKKVSVSDVRTRMIGLMRSQYIDYRLELDNKITSFLQVYNKRK